MTFEQSIVVGVAVTLGVVALIGAAMIWRTLGRTGRGLRELAARLDGGGQELPNRAAAARERLIDVRGESERVLWTLSNLDARMESTQATLADKRAASDRLRASMTSNQHVLERMRSGAGTLLRVIRMRREFLG